MDHLKIKSEEVDIPYAGIYPTQVQKYRYPAERDPQNPLHDGTEFYVQCAIKLVHEHEKFQAEAH